MTETPSSIRRWASRPGAAALLATARAKVETGRSGDRTRLPVEAAHRADVGRMLGYPWERSGRDVTLKALREALERSGTSLEGLLVEVGGPLRNAAAERAQASADDAEHRARLLETLTGAGIPEQVAVTALRSLGPVEVSLAVAEQVASAWRALPVSPAGDSLGTAARPVGLAEFAGQVLGDPHALDRDRHAGRALVRCVAAVLAGQEPVGADVDDPPGPGDEETEPVAPVATRMQAREWRSTWAAVGVLCDQVSSTVLVLNLPLTGQSGSLAALTGVAGEPVWVTSRMTDGGCAVHVVEGGPLVVRVCENPSVMEAAAAELGERCPPLVCLYGRPSGAAWDVLAAVAAAGGSLLVSADRDVEGKQIAAEVARSFPGSVTSWLPAAVGLFEEQRLPALLADLASSS